MQGTVTDDEVGALRSSQLAKGVFERLGILKPLLYAGMQESGELLPTALVPDIPTRFPGFAPENFDESYSGAVPAWRFFDTTLTGSMTVLLLHLKG